MIMVIVFLCGVLNFALHKAIIESRHPLLAQLPWLQQRRGVWALRLAEFFVLVVTMLEVHSGHRGWALGYVLYTAFNATSGWLIVTRRI